MGLQLLPWTSPPTRGILLAMTPRMAKKIVFLTGAGSGFGRATALAFAREGAAVACLVERDPERLDAVCAAVERLGARAIPVAADLGDPGSRERAVRPP